MTNGGGESIIDHYRKEEKKILRQSQRVLPVVSFGGVALTILLSLSIALLAGLFMSRLTKIWNLPAVTGYLVAGILIGPYCLGALGVEGIGFISSADVKKYDIISTIVPADCGISTSRKIRHRLTPMASPTSSRFISIFPNVLYIIRYGEAKK